MDALLYIESQRKIFLPQGYKDFYTRCAISIPENLVGTDLINNSTDLNQWAQELLAENKVNNFLNRDDFVFMMHQGYMFWYFKATGEPDPIVYGYRVNNIGPDKHARFSEFIHQFGS